MTGNINSALAKEVELVINVGVEKEACPLGICLQRTSYNCQLW